MKLYNTLTRQTDLFTPIKPDSVGIYTCGPTVYDYSHIGHWYNYVRMDTLVRALRAEAYNITWVMNITDVGHLVSDADDGEDKLEKGARREGKTAWEVAEFYTEDFLTGLEQLRIVMPDHIVKATDHIAEQIELIQQLSDKGYTYIIDDGVYYDTSKFVGYAAFAGLDLDEQQAGGRVSTNPQKRNQSDFALWKFSPAGTKRDMEWASPFGADKLGFPGWHIECSAMSMKYLGPSFDIHTGGIDHIPVHHTNEIAQSEAVTGQRLANYWFHSNHVTVNGEKVSKSLGNGIRLPDIIAKGYTPAAVRLNILESHYRSQSKFSWESVEAAQHRLQHWRQVASLVWQTQATSVSDSDTLAAIADTSAELATAISTDLDTPAALSLTDKLLTVIENNLLSTASAAAFQAFLAYLDSILGINLMDENGPINDDQVELIKRRAEARGNKDWALSDQFRDQLTKVGIGVRDLPTGAILWFRM